MTKKAETLPLVLCRIAAVEFRRGVSTHGLEVFFECFVASATIE